MNSSDTPPLPRNKYHLNSEPPGHQNHTRRVADGGASPAIIIANPRQKRRHLASITDQHRPILDLIRSEISPSAISQAFSLLGGQGKVPRKQVILRSQELVDSRRTMG